MSTKRTNFLIGVLIVVVMLISACGEVGETGPAGPQGEAGPVGPQGSAGEALDVASLGCTECHNDTTVITGKTTSWSASGHGMGTSYDYAGGRSDCTGCHSGGSFTQMIAEGLKPNEVELGDPNPTRQDCRACHQIHTTYTSEDWALTTVEAVDLAAFESETFDGGKGNLCVNCHQPRSVIAEAVDGEIEVTSTNWGPHHGPQSAMLLGLGGAGVEGSAAAHARMLEDTCVSCHVNEGANHKFEPSLTPCLNCHIDAEDFDIKGLQTDVAALGEELLALLEAAGSYNDGHPVPGTYSEAVANATWTYIYVFVEDGSLGVHNPDFTRAMLEAALASFQE